MAKPPRHLMTAREILGRIASALDQPVSALYDEAGSALRETETLALVRAFDLIADHQARARCIAFVTAEAEREKREPFIGSGELAT